MANLHHGACFALLAACSGAALADDPVRAGLEAQASTQESVFASGLSAWLDPRTGRPGDPGASGKALRLPPVASRRDDSKLSYQTVPGVGVLIRTNGQIEMASWVRPRADGTIEEYCLPQAHEASPAPGPRP